MASIYVNIAAYMILKDSENAVVNTVNFNEVLNAITENNISKVRLSEKVLSELQQKENLDLTGKSYSIDYLTNDIIFYDPVLVKWETAALSKSEALLLSKYGNDYTKLTANTAFLLLKDNYGIGDVTKIITATFNEVKAYQEYLSVIAIEKFNKIPLSSCAMYNNSMIKAALTCGEQKGIETVKQASKRLGIIGSIAAAAFVISMASPYRNVLAVECTGSAANSGCGSFAASICGPGYTGGGTSCAYACGGGGGCGTCAMSCGNSCSGGCSSSCSGGCSGCTGSCSGSCSAQCAQGCGFTCGSLCASGCGSGCGGCSITCTGGCNTTCSNGCQGQCNGCSSTCTGGCHNQCTGCNSGCQSSCLANCASGAGA